MRNFMTVVFIGLMIFGWVSDLSIHESREYQRIKIPFSEDESLNSHNSVVKSKLTFFDGAKNGTILFTGVVTTILELLWYSFVDLFHGAVDAFSENTVVGGLVDFAVVFLFFFLDVLKSFLLSLLFFFVIGFQIFFVKASLGYYIGFLLAVLILWGIMQLMGDEEKDTAAA